MSTTVNKKATGIGAMKYTVILGVCWTVFLCVLVYIAAQREVQSARKIAQRQAYVHHDRNEAFRNWAASHGGVYVPTDERTPPNVNLSHIPERDIVTPAGQLLTLMNPAYMLRQISEEYEDWDGIKGCITSNNPLRPENVPDEWEQQALDTFEHGKK